MLLDMLAALLVGRESQGLGVLERGAGFGDFQGEALEQFDAQLSAVGGALEAAGDEFVKGALEFVGGKDARGASRGQPAVAQEPAGSGAGEVHEIFHQALGGCGGDVVRDPRSVGEHPAGQQGVGRVLEFEGAAPAGDILDRVEGKGVAPHFVIGGTLLAPAADHREGAGFGRIQIQIEPARLGHVGREELRRGLGPRFRLGLHDKKSKFVMRWTTFIIPLFAANHYGLSR